MVQNTESFLGAVWHTVIFHLQSQFIKCVVGGGGRNDDIIKYAIPMSFLTNWLVGHNMRLLTRGGLVWWVVGHIFWTLTLAAFLAPGGARRCRLPLRVTTGKEAVFINSAVCNPVQNSGWPLREPFSPACQFPPTPRSELSPEQWIYFWKAERIPAAVSASFFSAVV